MAASELASLRYSASLARRTAPGGWPAHCSASERATADRSAWGTPSSNSPRASAPPAGTHGRDDAEGVAVREQREGFPQLVAQGAVQRVELLRPVECHRADAPRDFHQHALVRRHQARSTIIAIPWPTPMHMAHNP